MSRKGAKAQFQRDFFKAAKLQINVYFRCPDDIIQPDLANVCFWEEDDKRNSCFYTKAAAGEMALGDDIEFVF